MYQRLMYQRFLYQRLMYQRKQGAQIMLNVLIKFSSILFLFVGISANAIAIEWDIKSVRGTISRPDTSHTLTLSDPLISDRKIIINLTPLNNERFGVFVDINGVEIGYAVDVFKDSVETDTDNFIVSYRKRSNLKVTLNYQQLEGLRTEVERLGGGDSQTMFVDGTTSTRISLSGQHSLFTFNDKASLFDHFFLNRPVLSDSFDFSLSILAGWSVQSLSLKNTSVENNSSILFTPDNFDQDLPNIAKLDSISVSANIGPMVSISLPNNFHMFAEYRFGVGHINNRNQEQGLKNTGRENIRASGGGISWTSEDKKTVVLLRAWRQQGRHITNSFGDLSVVRFF